MLVSVFGASVTQQDRHHKSNEITGYFPVLKDLLTNHMPECTVSRLSAGSSHFDGAGYVLLDEVLNTKPDLLLLDWHSTSLDSFDETLWASAIQKIEKAGVPTIILIFPRKTSALEGVVARNIEQAYSVESNQIKILNLYSLVGRTIDIQRDLRDEVHTTATGAQVYANLVFEYTKNMLDGKIRSLNTGEEPIRTAAANPVSVASYTIGSDYVAARKIQLELSNFDDNHIRIIADERIGPFSPVINLQTSEEIERTISAWDSYCHYTRQTYGSLGSFHRQSDNEKISIAINISPESPEYQNSGDTLVGPVAFEQRYLALRKLCVIGAKIIDSIEIEVCP